MAMPSSAQEQAERPFWGKHWDPGVSAVEEAFYGWGQKYLLGMLSGCLGRAVAPRAILKSGLAVNPRAPIDGWGQVMELFDGSRPPTEVYDGWQNIVDRLTGALAPQASSVAAGQAMAIRSALMSRIGDKVFNGPKVLPPWEVALADATRLQRETMAWTAARGAEYAVNLTANARHSILTSLVDSRQAQEGPKLLERRLFDKFSALNRDWRRLALTESAMAVQNGLLSSVNPKEGWLAVWHCAPTACPYCLAQRHRRFRVVSADDPAKNGETDIWPGKNNIGRSAHRYSTKQGRFRDRAEMWWPCTPVHPNCACLLTLREARGPRPSSLKG